MKIKPRLLKGFRDFIGDDLKIRKVIFALFEETFQKYGYEPLETPALEYFDILMGKYGEEEKLVYQFKDHGDRQVAMKYDLTVPTARVMAQYQDTIKLPWKRYQIQPVWRADNTQKGRFREFYQLDADTFGVESCIVDAEFIDMGIEILKKLGFKDFKVRLNSRNILNGIVKYAGREDKLFEIIYAIDKWDKMPIDETRANLLSRLKSDKFTEKQIKEQVDRILSCVELVGTNIEKLNKLEILLKGIPEGEKGVKETKDIINLYSVNPDYIAYDATIARGLAYYTGPIWEFNIIEGGVGSVAGCGRYDKLVGQFIGRDIPATGGSFGIERIIEVMKDRDMLKTLLPKSNKILVIALNEEVLKYAYQVSDRIRKSGCNVTLYPLVQKPGKAITYALDKGFDKIVILGENEIRDGLFTVKNLTSKEQKTVSYDELISYIS